MTAEILQFLPRLSTEINRMLLDRYRGVPSMQATAETDSDPRNPNISDTSPSEILPYTAPGEDGA